VTQVLTVRDVFITALSGHAFSAMTTRNSAPLASYIDLLLDAVCAVDKQGRFVLSVPPASAFSATALKS
jgi:hypothetical protein